MLVPSRLALNYSFSYSCLLVFLRWLEWRITETDGLHPCILLCPSEGHPDVKGASRRYLPRDLSQILLYLPMWFVLLKILTLFQLLLILVWCSWSCWFFSTFFMNGFFFFFYKVDCTTLICPLISTWFLPQALSIFFFSLLWIPCTAWFLPAESRLFRMATRFLSVTELMTPCREEPPLTGWCSDVGHSAWVYVLYLIPCNLAG